jgi:UDP-3-O-[3-hydroxymyristoyl] glucosamine N-acyltransferase
MQLSELDLARQGNLVRDGRFRTLGFVDHSGHEMLVALYEGRYLELVERSPDISCVITTEGLAERIPSGLGLLIVADPRNALYDIHDYLFWHTDFYGTSVSSRIHPTARVHPQAHVAPQDVEIGAGVLIEPNATILAGTAIGQGAVVRAGSVIGAEGFGVRQVDGRQVSIPHAGRVSIGEQVHVLSNCTVVRTLFGGATAIGDYSVINAQSYVAHNVSIGKRCRIGAAVVVAGSSRVGDDVWIGPNAVISNSVRIGDGASVSLGAVVINDVAPGERVSGHFAMPHRRFLSLQARFRQGDV